jgi:hypothetical protein
MKHARTITRKEVWKRVCVFLMKIILITASLIEALETIKAFLRRVLG